MSSVGGEHKEAKEQLRIKRGTYYENVLSRAKICKD